MFVGNLFMLAKLAFDGRSTAKHGNPKTKFATGHLNFVWLKNQ